MPSPGLVLHGVRSPVQALRSTRGMDSLAQGTFWFLEHSTGIEGHSYEVVGNAFCFSIFN